MLQLIRNWNNRPFGSRIITKFLHWCNTRSYYRSYVGLSSSSKVTQQCVKFKLFGIIMSTRKGVNRKRAAASLDAAGGDAGGNVEDGKTLEMSTGNVAGRSTRSRKPIKIEVEREEVEHGGSNDIQGEDSKASVVKREKGKKSVLKGTAIDVSATPPTEKAPPPSPSPSKKKNVEPVRVNPPKNWKEMLENIQTMRSSKTAAVDTMGCERTADLKKEPKVQRFHTLVSLILSSQTKDQVTFAAVERLKERDLTVQTMINVDEAELAEILKPVGFFNRKATYIKKVAGILREKYDDDIPRTVEDLCALPGVGPKMAYICMNAAWNENAGIGVDTHVHRISNRLKWTGPKGTSTPEKTREALESWLPREMWQEINILLVGFGQEICLPIGPKCSTCLNKDICPSANIPRKSKKKQGKE